MLSLKGTVAGRFLWQLGTPFVEKHGLASLQNCAFTTVNTPRAFTWAFDMLMLGSGVGYNVQREYVYKLPIVQESFRAPVRLDTASADFIIPDTREGWVSLLERTLESAFKESKAFTYSSQLIRGKGTPIKGFGGVASGPEDLCNGIAEISQILERRRGKQLNPIDCLDIMNIIGSIVVSGNVRRSAQIAIGDYDDTAFLRAKRWDLGNIPSWRAMSNNSFVCSDVRLLPEEFWDGYRGNGEPYGLINLKLARSCGRTGDTQYPDKLIAGFNPCAEQSLAPFETCCLSEIYLPNIGSREELVDVSRLLYRVCKHSLALPCHHAETEQIVHKHMRMGIGITGYLQASEEQRSWLKETYEELRRYDQDYSHTAGFPTSIKLTTVKPSGTLSLLPGVTPGCHPAYARYLIRRIRVASNHSLVDICRNAGYKI
jgi:ribonucleoside-triphosphate reductase